MLHIQIPTDVDAVIISNALGGYGGSPVSLAGMTAVVSQRQESDPHEFTAVPPDRHCVWRSQQSADGVGVAQWIELLNEVARVAEDAHNSPSVERSGLFCDLPEGRLGIPLCGGWSGQLAPPTVKAAKTR